MYQKDSFFDLSPWGQVGLVAISTFLFLLVLLAAWKLLKPRGSLIRIVGALVLFWLFVWLSPQVYYMYYWTYFPDLPMQWVIWPPPGPDKAVKMLFFQYRENLSAHSKGLLGWCLITAPFAAPFAARFTQNLWQKLRL